MLAAVLDNEILYLYDAMCNGENSVITKLVVDSPLWSLNYQNA